MVKFCFDITYVIKFQLRLNNYVLYNIYKEKKQFWELNYFKYDLYN
jgi:hypothetical protein